MGLIYAQGGSLGDSGGGVIGASVFESQGVHYTGNRPCFVWFRGDLYCIGYYTRPVVRHSGDGGNWRLGGIRPPKRYLAVVPGASAGGSSGACLAAITFLHKQGLRVLAESNFSNVVDVGTLTGEGRVWSNVDDTSAEDRVTHVRGYVSMSGDIFRTAWEAPYGVTGYVENIRTGQLTYAGSEDVTKTIPPATMFGHAWAGRMWYARSSNHPYRVWFSEPNFPQYVNPANFRDTWDKETITAIWKGRNELLVFCERANYLVRQFGQGTADFVLEKLDSDVGCINHFGIMEIHNKLWFPAEDGPWMYDGSFRYLGKEILPLWKTDWEANREAFRNGFAMHDRINKDWIYVTRRDARPEFERTGLYPGTVAYVGYYGAWEPSLAGEQPHPDWTLDFKDRFDSCGYYDADGELVIGSCDGKIRKQDWDDGDDDGDALQKTAIIRPGHQLYNDPGDDWESGKKLHQLWAYVESEATAWTMYVRGGDEQVWRSKLPDNLVQGWKGEVAASAKEETRLIRLWDGDYRTLKLKYVPVTGAFFLPENVTGQGFTFELRAIAPVRFQYRGLGGMWGPGPSSTRMVEDYTRATIGLEYVLSKPICPASSANQGFAYPEAFTGTVTQDLLARATIVYLYGTPAYPIRVTFTLTPTVGAETYTETVTINSGLCVGGGEEPDPCPCPPGTTPPWTVTAPWHGTIVATMEDANGITATSEVESITIDP